MNAARTNCQRAQTRTQIHRADRLLYLIARQLGRAAALVSRADLVERSFAADDLLEVAGMSWLLARLIADPADQTASG